MSWILRRRCRTFLKTSFLAPPIAAMAVAMLAAPLVRSVDDRMRWTLMNFGPDGARAVVGTLSASLLTFIVFAFSIMLLAVQVAGGQLSPRIIARIFESRHIRLTLSAFVFSYSYSLAALGRIEERVPQLAVVVAILSSLVSIALFLYLIQRSSESFRPVMILTQVADDTCLVIDELYPHPFSPPNQRTSEPDGNSKPAQRTIAHRGRSGVVLEFDAVGLMEIARLFSGVVELVPEVGDFLATGEDLFRLYGPQTGAADEAGLRRCIVLGPERTLDQDPAFGFRIIVDIAIKALSPAINDPTTGALAVDQIHHLLHVLGQRQLAPGVLRDASGDVRLIYRTPCWEDFVTLAVTEIRLCGATSPQITRRLAEFERHGHQAFLVAFALDLDDEIVEVECLFAQ